MITLEVPVVPTGTSCSLLSRGAAGASIEAIARRAGVAKLTVYRRWQSKEDLLMAALELARSPDTDHPRTAHTLDEVVEHTAELLSQSRFRALMARVIGASVDHPKLVRAYTARYLEPRLHGDGDIAAEQIKGRLHTMLRQMGYRASSS